LPPDILLPLFALTLVANAVLVAVAIRAIWRGRADGPRPIESGRPATPSEPVAGVAVAPPANGPDRPMTDELARAIAARRPSADQPGLFPATPDPAPPADPGPPHEPDETAVIDGGTSAAGQDTQPAPTPPKRRRTSKSVSPPGPSGSRSAGTRPVGGRRGRRRFALPPLDDDHERVSRSIETFLGGMETADADVPPAPADDPPDGPSTVALVAVHEVPGDGAAAAPDGDATSSGSAGEADTVTDAVAMVERTLRGAARGTDVVTTGGHGRFRVVLPSTGEFAARAYLRRIRAAIEPRLVAADRPLRLTVAMTTVLDEPLEDAVRRAERRLTAAIEDVRLLGDEGAADPRVRIVDTPTARRAAPD